MTQEGIIFKPNVNIGETFDPNELVEDFDAVLLAIGATWPRDLPIPGKCETYLLIFLLMH